MNALNPGILRHSITWQRKTLASPSPQNTYGEEVYTWEDVVTMKAEVRSLTGRELASSNQKLAEAQYVITQHYREGLRREDRISVVIDGAEKTLNVLDITDPLGTQRKQVIYAKELVA